MTFYSPVVVQSSNLSDNCLAFDSERSLFSRSASLPWPLALWHWTELLCRRASFYPPLVSLSSRTHSHSLAALQLQLVVDSVTMFRMEVAVVDACALKGWLVIRIAAASMFIAWQYPVSGCSNEYACRTVQKGVLLLVFLALTKRSSLHGEYLAAENTW